MKKSIGIRIHAATALAATLGACATSKSVDQKIAEAQSQTSKKVESVEGHVDDLLRRQAAGSAEQDAQGPRGKSAGCDRGVGVNPFHAETRGRGENLRELRGSA